MDVIIHCAECRQERLVDRRLAETVLPEIQHAPMRSSAALPADWTERVVRALEQRRADLTCDKCGAKSATIESRSARTTQISPKSSTTPEREIVNETNFFLKLRDKLNREILDIENRTDLTQDEKVKRVIHATCAVCAGLAVQPIPFADLFILTPIQSLMGIKIANIYGIDISKQKAGNIIKELVGIVGLGLAAQQLVIGVYKFAIPFMGAVTTIPLVYGTTYAIGNVVDYYFHQQAMKRPFDAEVAKKIWRQAKAEGKKRGKSESSQIRQDLSDDA